MLATPLSAWLSELSDQMALRPLSLQQQFSFEAIKLYLRLQSIAGLSTTSQLLKKSKCKEYRFSHEEVCHVFFTETRNQLKSDISIYLSCLQEIFVIRRKGEFLYSAGPCLAALKANRRKIHAVYMLQDDTQREGTIKT